MPSAFSKRKRFAFSPQLVKVVERRDLVQYSMASHPISERQACRLLNLTRTACRYQAEASDDESLRKNLLASWRGYPQQLQLDIGPEMISSKMAEWSQEHPLQLAFVQPVKPAQNAYFERFNRTLREEVLDGHLFHSLKEAQEITQTWLEEYNAIRPHEALGDQSPFAFAPENR